MTAAVTVVVPTRDRRELLAETVASIAAQTVPVEVVVVDDGSSDGTAAWLAGAGAGAGVTAVRLEVSRGPSVARNVGAALATTPWLAFCDDDDLWAPDRLAAQLDALVEHPSARWACTGCVSIDTARHIVGGQRMPDHDDALALLREGDAVPGGGSAVLVDAALFAAVGGFAEDLDGTEDWDLWLRLAAHSPVAYVDRPLVGYRVWPGNRSRDLGRTEKAHAEIARRHGITVAAGRGGSLPSMHRARLMAERGDRVAAARAYLGAAVSGRAPGQLAYAGAVLASPARVLRRLQDLDRARLPAGWDEEARRWLGAR